MMSNQTLNLGQALLRSESRFRDRTAILHPVKGEYVPLTFGELVEQVHAYAAALHGLGLRRGDRLAIQGENSLEWALTDWACQTLGVVVVPIYPTLPADQTQYIVQDAGAKVVIAANPEQAAKSEGMEGVQVVLMTGGEGALATLVASRAYEMPKNEWLNHIDAVAPTDLATIIYTSGTTGNPKGAMLQHQAFTLLADNVLGSLPVDENDVFLSFLPISHVYERFAGHFLPTLVGATIAYAQSLRTLASDLVTVRPTIMLCVPRFLEAFKSRILETIQKAPHLRRRLFALALDQGTKRFRGESAPLAGVLDKLVGKKIRERTGGRIRFFVSGGAAMPMHVAEFFGAFRLTVLQGYGLTETTAATCFNPPDDNRPHTVGKPIRGVEIKIAPDGEILIKGVSRMVGYYNLPDETAAAIDEEGWFHSGDIGEFEGEHLKITDRKKDILVLGNGKNVSPARIEGILKEGSAIAEAVCFGDGMEYVCALIVPDFELIRGRLAGEALPDDPEAFIRDERVRRVVKEDVDRANQRLADFEKVKRHTLLAQAFTIESGELTPSMKVRRKVVREKFADEIASLGR